jgi:hypothetical protein
VRFEELSTDETAYSLPNWTSMSITPVEMLETKVRALVVKKVVDAQISINGDLFSPEHPILVESNGKYFFAQAGDVALGDKVLKRTGDNLSDLVWTIVLSNDVIFESATVYLFDTEDQDVLFTKGMLTHNFKL